jgi:uncharacterized phage protein gp47/JayE
MTVYGVTPTGFIKKPFAVIVDEIVEAYRDELGRSIDLSDESPDGQIIGINAIQIASLWDALEASYYAKYPHTATGISLDNACLATNSKRETALKSVTTLTLTGAVNTIIPIGTLAETPEGIRVATTEGGIIAPGETTATVAASAIVTGPIVALAGTINKMTSPISGITAVTNATDLIGGIDDETDADFKLRRIYELQRPGKPTADGIRNQLLELPYVLKAFTVSNKRDEIDIDGRPPHSIECFITANIAGSLSDPENADKRAEIAAVILKSKADGIQTWGQITETTADSQGTTEDIMFSEPIPVSIIINATLSVNATLSEGPLFPNNGIDQIKLAILEYGASLGGGQDVWRGKILAAILSVAGVKSITALTINGSAVSDVTIGQTQISKWLSSSITIGIS